MKSKIKYASLFASGFSNNQIFDLAHKGNRDNCYYPYWLLKEKFKLQGVELNTPDINMGQNVLFELHMDVMKRVEKSANRYVLLWETPQILPQNRNSKYLEQYKFIFTWDDDLVDNSRCYKLNMPNEPKFFDKFGYNGREKLCCIIAGNKIVRKKDWRELYTKRVETIRWFEKNAREDFDLYGTGWECYPPKRGYIGRVVTRLTRQINQILGVVPFPSYKGRVDNKFETLSQYKFSICYENVSDLNGYITEKIFDSFFAGCVPVYWGAANTEIYIPKECFIDRRDFADDKSLYLFLKNMDVKEYEKYQESINKFIKSENALAFYSEYFSDFLVEKIMEDVRQIE